MLRLLPIASVLVALAAPAAAGGQSSSVRGSWVGTALDGTVRVRFDVTALTVGRAAGRTLYLAPEGQTCRGRLTLRARQDGGYVFRDRVAAGSSDGCSSGDRIFMKRTGARVSVRVTVMPTRRVVRFTLRRG